MSSCAICFEEIEVAKTGRTTLSCAHEFHYSCLTRWFISAIDADGNPSCPCCRKQMDGLENYPEYEGEEDEEDDEDDEDDEDEEDPTFWTFAQLKAFVRLRGGWGISMSYWMSMRNLITLPRQVCFASIDELNEVLLDHRASAIAAAEYDTWDEHLPFNPYVSHGALPNRDGVASVHLMGDGAWTTTVLNPEEDTGISVCLPKDEASAAGTVAHLLAKKIQRTWKASRITVQAEAMAVQEEDESWFEAAQQPIALEALEAQLMTSV
jgi:hypothetical protein